MGNRNLSGDARKLGENERLAANNGKNVNRDYVKKVQNGREKEANCVSDNFVVHGIDFLPESAKKKARRKKNVPKILQFDEPLWLNNRLNFLARIQNVIGHGNGTVSSRSADKETCNVLESDGTQVTTRMMRSQTACAGFSDEKLLDWKTYEDYPFRNIVMSGGGSKGYAYIGSLKALEDCGILKNVTRVAGSSAGAICAGLLAVGCTPQEIADVFKCDIKWLFHDQKCTCCCLPSVCNKFGIHPAHRFHEIYGEHLEKKVGNPDITFLQLKKSLERELCIVVTNLSRMCSEYFNHRNTPDLPIRDAVRMSMAFPVVFRAVRYNLDGKECVFTDGGLLDQYPIHCFDDDVNSNSNNNSSNNEEEEEEETGTKHQDEFKQNRRDRVVAVGGNYEGTNDNDNARDLPNMTTLGLYVVSEKPIDHKIWQALFGKEIPCKPTYLPNTKLARERLEKEISKRKMHNKKFDKQEFMDELCSSVGDGAKHFLDHYSIWNKSHVDITNFGEYFMATLETLLISQRRLKIKSNDSLRTVPINCGYIGTNDYVIEPGDREFMIDQGYTGTVRYLREFIAARNSSAASHGKKSKVPRSRSTNLAERCLVHVEEIACNGTNPEVRSDLHAVTTCDFFLPTRDEGDGAAPENSRDHPRCRRCSRDSSDSRVVEIEEELSIPNLQDPPLSLSPPPPRKSEAEGTASSPQDIHRDPFGRHDDGGGKEDFDDDDIARMSVSLGSEGYRELVNLTIAALSQSEYEPMILESRV